MIDWPDQDRQEFWLDALRLLLRRRGLGVLQGANVDPNPLVAAMQAEQEGPLLDAAATWVEGVDPDRRLVGLVRDPPRWPGGLAGLMLHQGGMALLVVRRQAAQAPAPAAADLALDLARHWRRRQELVVSQAHLEEALVELTAVLLGFGPVLAAARVEEARPEPALGPSDLGWLLAVRELTRGGTCWEAIQVARRSPPATRATFLATLVRLGRPSGALAERLELDRLPSSTPPASAATGAARLRSPAQDDPRP